MAAHLAPSLTADRPSLARVRETLSGRRLRPAARARLADRLEQVVTEPPRRDAVITARVPVDREAVRMAERELLAIAARLRAEPAPRVEGVTAAARLLTDGAGPMYTAAERDRLKRAAGDVLSRL